MARYAIIDAGRVVNIIEADAEFAASIGAVDAKDSAIGDFHAAGVFLKPPPLPFDRTAAADQIDAAVLAIYEQPMTLSKEYEAREAAALAYKAANHTGAVPVRLAAFAIAAGITADVASDIILSQAGKMRGALAALGDLRMRKFELNRAATEAEARAVHADVIAKIAAIGADL